MINLTEKPADIGEIACVQDVQTGDYSLSLHGAIDRLIAENERLQVIIDDLRRKIECLDSILDLPAFGSA